VACIRGIGIQPLIPSLVLTGWKPVPLLDHPGYLRRAMSYRSPSNLSRDSATMCPNRC
jgi:hypothetical protein